MEKNRLIYLVNRFQQRTCTAPEKQELKEALSKSNEQEMMSLLSELIAEAAQHPSFEDQEKMAASFERIVGIDRGTAYNTATGTAKSKLLNMYRWVAAASIIILLGIGLFFYIKNDRLQSATVTSTPKDIEAPETNRAMITLADGSTVYLDNAGNGQLAQQENVQLVKLANGQIAYHLSATEAETATGKLVTEMKYNTLSNPRGSKVIDMQLSDGSHVWLNAGSSVTYPVIFNGNERNITISGEAYFEIAHNKSQPFTVSKGSMKVEVLGTHFNVNAYDDETGIKVTLLEGSVKVNSGQNTATLKPGEQAQLNNDGNPQISNNLSRQGGIMVQKVDTDQSIAWVKGMFYFDNTDVQTMMRQLARWYNVEVVFESTITRRFGGKIPRSMSAANVFRILEETGGVHFYIVRGDAFGKGNPPAKIIVKP